MRSNQIDYRFTNQGTQANSNTQEERQFKKILWDKIFWSMLFIISICCWIYLNGDKTCGIEAKAILQVAFWVLTLFSIPFYILSLCITKIKIFTEAFDKNIVYIFEPLVMAFWYYFLYTEFMNPNNDCRTKAFWLYLGHAIIMIHPFLYVLQAFNTSCFTIIRSWRRMVLVIYSKARQMINWKGRERLLWSTSATLSLDSSNQAGYYCEWKDNSTPVGRTTKPSYSDHLLCTDNIKNLVEEKITSSFYKVEVQSKLKSEINSQNSYQKTLRNLDTIEMSERLV